MLRAQGVNQLMVRVFCVPYTPGMDPTLKIVPCPCCKSVLYTLKPKDESDSVTWRLTADSPTIRKDPQGSFMNCPRCARRIALASGDESPGFRLSPKQHCP